jgi:hypothetical protein
VIFSPISSNSPVARSCAASCTSTIDSTGSFDSSKNFSYSPLWAPSFYVTRRVCAEIVFTFFGVTAGASPEVIAAIAACNLGQAQPYGADERRSSQAPEHDE